MVQSHAPSVYPPAAKTPHHFNSSAQNFVPCVSLSAMLDFLGTSRSWRSLDALWDNTVHAGCKDYAGYYETPTRDHTMLVGAISAQKERGKASNGSL